MERTENVLIKNDLLEFYKKYSSNLLNDKQQYRTINYDEHNFHFTNKTEFVKCNKFDTLQNSKPLDHLNGVYLDCNRQTYYNYDNTKNEFTFIDWFYEGEYKRSSETKMENPLEFSKSLNELIKTYFPNLSDIDIDKNNIDILKTIKSDKMLKYNELEGISDEIKLLLYNVRKIESNNL